MGATEGPLQRSHLSPPAHVYSVCTYSALVCQNVTLDVKHLMLGRPSTAAFHICLMVVATLLAAALPRPKQQPGMHALAHSPFHRLPPLWCCRWWCRRPCFGWHCSSVPTKFGACAPSPAAAAPPTLLSEGCYTGHGIAKLLPPKRLPRNSRASLQSRTCGAAAVQRAAA